MVYYFKQRFPYEWDFDVDPKGKDAEWIDDENYPGTVLSIGNVPVFNRTTGEKETDAWVMLHICSAFGSSDEECAMAKAFRRIFAEDGCIRLQVP